MPRPVANPPNPWSSTHVEYLEEPPPAELSVHEEQARSIIASNDSPDIPFRFSLNPYRGCLHACAYCYARPTHQHLGWGAGTDFDRKIVVKVNAAELLERELGRPSWQGDTLVFSGVTDCYQPLEASYRLTRRCLEVCLDFQNPVSIITKGALVRRDADLLGALARRARARVFMSIPFADDATSRAIEPYATRASLRFDALRVLADAGVPTGIAIAPVIPGLSEPMIPELLERARDAGASDAFLIPLRLPAEVLPVFRERIAAALPGQAAKIERAVLELRGGKWNESAFGSRFTAEGPRWAAVAQLFEIHARRLGLSTTRTVDEGPSPFRRSGRQRSLFDT